MSGSDTGRQAVERALERARRAGADAADALLVESDSMEARVRGDEIDFVKQARERTLGIRALVRGPAGMRSALTSTSDREIARCLRWLKETHGGTGFMHESFHQDDPTRFTRSWFAWANTLFGELVLKVHRERPHLLKG